MCDVINLYWKIFEDILSKAMRGLGIGKNEMTKRLGVVKSEIEAILNGDVDEVDSCLVTCWNLMGINLSVQLKRHGSLPRLNLLD